MYSPNVADKKISLSSIVLVPMVKDETNQSFVHPPCSII